MCHRCVTRVPFHDNDDETRTSKVFIWKYPIKQPVKNSIAVMSEINDDNLADHIRVCSDLIQNYTTK